MRGRAAAAIVLGAAALVAALGALIAADDARADWRPAWFAAIFPPKSPAPLPVEDIALRTRSAPAFEQARVLAASATAEGHWRFVNRAGETMTTASPEELRSALDRLVPLGEKEGEALAFVLTELTVFEHADMLRELPATAKLYAMVNGTFYPLTRIAGPGRPRLYAHVSPNLILEVGDRNRFDEALAQLSRSYVRHRLRFVALEPGTLDSISPTPVIDKKTGGQLSDRIDPVHLRAGFRSLRGQTVIVTGRIVGGLLHIQPSAGPETTVQLEALTTAAAEADVDLLVLHASSPRQPGSRNWLWLKAEIAELAAALESKTFAEFAQALGGGQPLMMSVPDDAGPRTRFKVQAADLIERRPLAGPVSDVISDIASKVTARLNVAAIEVDARSVARERELGRRIIPGIPWMVQALYLAGLVSGLAVNGPARRWWRRLWPMEERAEYGGTWGYVAASVARGLAFGFIFLPLTGPVSLVAGLTGILRTFFARRAAAEGPASS